MCEVNDEENANKKCALNLHLYKPEHRITTLYKPIINHQKDFPPRIITYSYLFLIDKPNRSTMKSWSNTPVYQKTC